MCLRKLNWLSKRAVVARYLPKNHHRWNNIEIPNILHKFLVLWVFWTELPRRPFNEASSRVNTFNREQLFKGQRKFSTQFSRRWHHWKVLSQISIKEVDRHLPLFVLGGFLAGYFFLQTCATNYLLACKAKPSGANLGRDGQSCHCLWCDQKILKQKLSFSRFFSSRWDFPKFRMPEWDSIYCRLIFKFEPYTMCMASERF